MDRLWTKGDRIEVLGIGQLRMSCLNSELTLGRFLAESWIGVVKSASHQLSQSEIASDNPCSRHLSGISDFLLLAIQIAEGIDAAHVEGVLSSGVLRDSVSSLLVF
jgi:hypothetical protein